MKAKRYAVVLACFLAIVNLSACTVMHSFEPVAIRQFKKDVSALGLPEKVKITSRYSYATDLIVTITSSTGFEKDSVFSILSLFSSVAQSDEFQSALLKTYEAQAAGDINWDLGRRPDIVLDFSTGVARVYSFKARYYTESYNSGLDPASYVYDGYKTWWGRDENEKYSYSPDEIQKIIESLR